MTLSIPNILAERYASADMRHLWSPEGKIILEREFWISVMKVQKELGLDIPSEAIESSERVKASVDLSSIKEREKVTKHDVKARLEEFAERSGHQHAHKGMTSRDLTENVEQLQIHRSLGIILERGVAGLCSLAKRAEEYKELPLTARSHNVPAQLTTLGKRFAMYGEELERGLDGLVRLCATYPFRGLKGAVGTRLDQITLLGDPSKVERLDKLLLEHLGAPGCLEVLGQVYPRSLDFEVVSLLFRVAAAPASFATTLRIAAGLELMSEGFSKGQTGSSAMPHKMNSRSCERINGFHSILRGHLAMVAGLSGDQWNEGDVSCSVVRRVVMPDAFFASDGLLETFLTILVQMEVFPEVIKAENRRQLPFLLSTTILMEAVKAGAGREDAHAAIKEHSIAAARDLREALITENDLPARLAADERLRLSIDKIEGILSKGKTRFGSAVQQTEAFLKRANSWTERYPDAAQYKPRSIL